MSYRVFKRDVWRANPSWPHGFEPNAVPMDQCRTLATFDTREEATDYCDERNEKWRKHSRAVRGGGATAKRTLTYYTASRYEWTEE